MTINLSGGEWAGLVLASFMIYEMGPQDAFGYQRRVSAICLHILVLSQERTAADGLSCFSDLKMQRPHSNLVFFVFFCAADSPRLLLYAAYGKGLAFWRARRASQTML